MIKHHANIEQGTPEWLALRRGILTASEMHLIITPTLKVASNEKERTHLYELLAQRITGYVEPFYISDDMLRGHEDEIDARDLYAKTYQPVEQVGFITNDEHGFTIGYSPDGLVGSEGLIEIKSRRQKYQVQTILDDACPSEYMIQIQTGLLVSGRMWCDFISYSGGLPMFVKRIPRLPEYINAITSAASMFEQRITAAWERYQQNSLLMPETIRRIEQEITV